MSGEPARVSDEETPDPRDEGAWREWHAAQFAALPVDPFDGTAQHDPDVGGTEKDTSGIDAPVPTPPGAITGPAPEGRASWDCSVDGATFLTTEGAEVPAVWGDSDTVAWSEGEPLFLVGPPGVGKSTVAQQLVLARLGLRDGGLLGMPVAVEPTKVLYLAADRPAQIARSMRRMVTPEDYPDLGERLQVWRGPLPFDLAQEPQRLTGMARHFGAGTVIIDSLKDVALELVKDDVGARVNLALQHALAEGLQVLVLHHQRKGSAGNPKPRGLDDVYGSRWLTAGAGSVLLLWGTAGDAVIDLEHLKQPAGDIGPLKLFHDHRAGTTTLYEGIDVYALVKSTRNGMTAKDAARALFSTPEPNRNEIEKARRRLDQLVARDVLVKDEGTSGGEGGGTPTRYLVPTLLSPA